MNRFIYLIIIALAFTACGNSQADTENTQNEKTEIIDLTDKNTEDEVLFVKDSIICGAEQPEVYLEKLAGKRIGLVVNQSSMLKNKHLVDFLLENKINVVKIFALEHGFRGDIDRGDSVQSETDKKTGIPIVSLFGKSHRPSNEQLNDVDIVMFDIQDVGVRFYTYISSMHEVMEACAANSKSFLVLDRPNPLGDYIDGPVLQPKFKSFVGMHAIPIVHGLTVGELALMINGEKWLENGNKCKLGVVKVKNYKHSDKYELPVKPSPNLPNYLSIRLYPSLCFFEATQISIGRGTQFPFQVIGYPNKLFGDSLFIPQDIKGMQMDPEQEGKICYGTDLRKLNPDTTHFTLKYITDFYKKFPDKKKFFSRSEWFNLLAGNDILIGQIKSGLSEDKIKASWKEELDKYKEMRKKYLLYEE